MGFFDYIDIIGFAFFSVWFLTIIFTIVLAVRKGYSGLLAFLLGLFIPLLGSLIIIALLPNKLPSSNAVIHGKQTTITSSPLSSSRQTTSNIQDSWICKKCSETNPNTSSFCRGCGEYK